MTELRKKMIRAMELKNLSHHTQRAYIAAVTGIAKFYNQSPDKMTQEKIEDYLLYLKLDKHKLAIIVHSSMASIGIGEDAKLQHLISKCLGMIPGFSALILWDICKFPTVCHLMQKR